MVKTLIFQNNFITVNDNKIITTFAIGHPFIIVSHSILLDSFENEDYLRKNISPKNEYKIL